MTDTAIKRIPVSELRVGMYVQKLDASWWKHPFLRGSFLLTDAADIATMVECGIRDVWIDPSKEVSEAEARRQHSAGKSAQPDTPNSEPAPQRPEQTARSPGPQSPSDVPAAPPEPAVAKRVTVSMAQEVDRAKRICLSAKSEVVGMFHAARLGKAIDPDAAGLLVDEIAASIERHPAALLSVARLKTHDDYTYLHSVAVCALMLSLARQLELDERQTRLAGIGGLMHDMGKASIPLDVLNKPGKLTDAEFAIVKRHTAAGAEMLQASGAEIEVQDVALHHQEKFDGTGYPDRLAGDAIPLLSRLAAVCDVYDAITSARPYKKPWHPSGAMHQMATWQGHFDRGVFNGFVKTVGIYPVGSLVKLHSHRLAVVVEPGAQSLLTPKVRMFFSLRSNEPVPMQTIDLAARACTDKIIGPEDPMKWGFKHLDHLWVE